jgi:nicotinamidase-related amidase
VPASLKKTALLIVDVINPYDFEDAERLVASARDAVPHIGELLGRARDEGVRVIYVNDNYGVWNASADELIQDVLRGDYADLLEPLVPDDDAAFVVKARHSVFYETPLEYLLRQEEIGRIVLTGQVTEQCILYSALDAYIRHLDVAVATDAVAHIYDDLAQAALKMMQRNMGAELSLATQCALGPE